MFRNRLLIICGTLSAVVGIIGIVVPVLPTTPFLLLAAVCYLRSSERFYRWLVENRLLGSYIRNYLEGRGIPLKTRIVTLAILWVMIGISIAFGTDSLVLRIILGMVATGVTIHIILMKSKSN